MEKREMKQMRRLVLIFIVGLFILSFVSAGCPDGEGYLGNKEYGSCVRISQTCASCTYVNISSITISTSNNTLDSDIEMVDVDDGEWVYQFCNTSLYGSYFIVGKGDVDGVDTSFKSCFDVGQNISVGESIIYFLFILILFGLLSIMFYFIIIMPKGNEKDNGVYVRIVRMKYIRIIIIALTYPIIIIILNLMNGLATQFATLSIFAGTLGFLFETMLSIAWVFTIIIILWILYLLIHDSNIRQNLKKLERFKF